jgi:hypothetical protein
MRVPLGFAVKTENEHFLLLLLLHYTPQSLIIALNNRTEKLFSLIPMSFCIKLRTTLDARTLQVVVTYSLRRRRLIA